MTHKVLVVQLLGHSEKVHEGRRVSVFRNSWNVTVFEVTPPQIHHVLLFLEVRIFLDILVVVLARFDIEDWGDFGLCFGCVMRERSSIFHWIW